MLRPAAWPSLPAPCWRRALAPGCGDTQTAGKLRYQLFAGENVFTVATFDSRAWVGTISIDPGPTPIRVINVAAGTFRETRRGVPRLLHPNFSTG